MSEATALDPRFRALFASWMMLALVDLFYAWQGFLTPPWYKVAFELIGFGIIALSQVRLAPEGWLRSPLWPGFFAVGTTLVWVDPAGIRTVFFYGLAIVLLDPDCHGLPADRHRRLGARCRDPTWRRSPSLCQRTIQWCSPQRV